MIGYLLKILTLLLFSFVILFLYYFAYPNHISNFDGYTFYIICLVLVYGIYKFFQLTKSNKKAVFSVPLLIGFFLLNLYILCNYYFFLNINPGDNTFFIFSGTSLFFKILFYSFLPILMFSIFTGFGNKIIEKLPNKEEFGIKVEYLLSMLLGFISFVLLMVIFATLGFFNLYVIFIILLIFSYFGYKNLIDIFTYIFNLKFEVDIDEGSYLKLLVSEFFYIVSFIVLATGLIYIFRPFPIGWDDLGVYMNFPNLIAQSGDLLSLGGMYSWQSFTAIGFLFGSNIAAFFINISGLFISFIVLNVVFSSFLSSDNSKKSLFSRIFSKDIKSFLPLPIMLSTLFISIPMVVFQTQKDLKVDEGLFFITVIGLFVLFKYLFLSKHSDKKISLIYIFIVGIIAGFAFSVKFTALLFIVSILGLLSFSRLGLIGFIGFILVFFGIFTLADFWKMMNVVINPNNIENFKSIFSLVTISSGVLLYIYSLFKNKISFILYIKEITLFLLGIILALSPWFIKNTSESISNLSIQSILSGTSDSFRPDFEKIHSEEELNKIKENYKESRQKQKENSITTNEDLLRYFGYENGIKDFFYMPYNLTMQKNQGGEFTDIGFLFLAFIPLIFIFLNYRNKNFAYFFILIAFFQLFLYFKPDKFEFDSSYLSNTNISYSGLYQENPKYLSDGVDSIKLNNYIGDDILLSSLGKTEKDTEFYQIKKQVEKEFNNEIKNKIKTLENDDKFEILNGASLLEDDFSKIKTLNERYNNNFIFPFNDIKGLENYLEKNEVSEEDRDLFISIWKEKRSLNQAFNDILSKINLPFGYLVLFSLFLILFIYIYFSLDKKQKENEVFIYNLVFSCLYVFLFLISAFGIVWYGITMYFSFLLMIGFGAYNLVSYTKDDSETIYLYKFIGSISFLTIFILYFFNSVIPQNFTNLKTASYFEFKNGDITENEAVYRYHPEYLPILFELNIDQSKKSDFYEKYIDKSILSMFENIKDAKIGDIYSILYQLSYSNNSNLPANIKQKAIKSLDNIYKHITYPEEEFKNKKNIYRAGTFLKYYISENNKRLLEDSLLFSFNDYIYDEDNSITLDRFKELDISYMLVDLNAATIDQSITHDLTTRFEKVLKTFTSNQLELVETDSICLRVGLDLYKTNKDIKEYLTIAGVNYESYDENNNTIYRQNKQKACASIIKQLIDNNLINENNFSYLLDMKKSLSNLEEITTENVQSKIKMSYKALFKIK